MTTQYEHIPSEILGLIESYLPHSDCAQLSVVSTSLHRRWTAWRWRRAFHLHYGRGNRLRRKERTARLREARKALMDCVSCPRDHSRRRGLGGAFPCEGEGKPTAVDQHGTLINAKAAFDHYARCYRDGWELTFVGCCHDHRGFCDKCICGDENETPSRDEGKETIFRSQSKSHLQSDSPARSGTNCQKCISSSDSNDDMTALTTEFNVTALVPSVQRLYEDLWDNIELALLGYYDAEEAERTGNQPTHHSQFPVPAIMRILRTSVLPDLAAYLYFVIGFKPLAVRGVEEAAARSLRRRDGGIMGPMLSRGLAAVRRESESMEPHPSGNSARQSGDTNARPSLKYSEVGFAETARSSRPRRGSTATTLEEINSLRNAATTMSAWKLACILRDQGVGCLRCAICDKIDLLGEYVDCDDTPVMEHEGQWREEGEGGDGHGGQAAGAVDAPMRSHHRPGAGTGGRRSPFLREFQRRVGGGDAWVTPCKCPEPVHRQCLEHKLGLIPKYGPWEHLKHFFHRTFSRLGHPFFRNGSRKDGAWKAKREYSRATNHVFELPSSLTDHNTIKETIAPRVWISYDNSVPVRRQGHHRPGMRDNEEESSIIAVDAMGRYRSHAARCEMCGCQFLRTVRLPRSKWEVVAASLSDPMSVMRATSTIIHFVLACAFLAACEGMCSDASCNSHRVLLNTSIGVMKWPTTGLNGFALAWWQLQQCCMLHIFFSRRFSAIVDRLWMGPISLFYCRLYFYFIVTSALLTASYIPMVSRTIRANIIEPFISPWILELLQPVADLVALANLAQYAVVSTTVICIFWRTNFRIYTVADGKEDATTLRRREELARNIQGDADQRRDARQNINIGAQDAGEQNADPLAINAIRMQRIVGVGAGDNDAANHPIYHGPW
ncbi:hypothetical protein ACHAWF_010943 [Thalassiosira exigua]